MDLDLTGIFHFILNAFNDIASNDNDLIVADDIGLNENSDFAAGLDSEAVVDSLEGVGDAFKFFKTFNIIFEVFTSCTGSCGGNGIGSLNKTSDNALGLDIAVMGFDSVDNLGIFLVFFSNIHTDVDVGSFNFVGHRLTDIMEKTGTSCGIDIGTDLGGEHTCDMSDLDGMNENVLTVAGTVAHSSEEFNDLGVYSVNAGFDDSALAVLLDLSFDFLA